MSVIDTVLSKVFVRRFYSENSGFFLVCLGVCFGFLKSTQHYELSVMLAQKPFLYVAPFTLWVLYAVKVQRFSKLKSRLDENALLSLLELESNKNLMLSTLKVQTGMLAPVILYGIFMISVAIENAFWGSAVLVLFFLLALTIVCSIFQFKNLKQANDFGYTEEKSIIRWKPKQYFEFYLHYILSTSGLQLILIKLFSLLILFIAIQVFLEEAIDLRYLTLGVLLSATANSYFSFDYSRFERSDLQLFRNLPSSFAQKSGSFFMTFLLLSVPEYLILIAQTVNQTSVFSILGLMIMLPAMLLLYHSLAYRKVIDQELFTKQIFIITTVLFFVILGGFSASVLSFFVLVSALAQLKLGLKNSDVT